MNGNGSTEASSDGTVTWGSLLDETRARLEAVDADLGASDAHRIVAEAAGVSAGELLLVRDRLATERGVAHLDDMVTRRLEGEPLQYVLGSWGFRSLDLMVDHRVLIPRPETEQVVETALQALDRVGGRERPTRVVDLGTGSGAIALSIAVATANLAGIGRPAARVQLLHGSWFEALPHELRGTVDLIVSNPPYVATTFELPEQVTRWEPSHALWSGEDGLDDLRVLIDGAGEWLVDDGALVCELSPEQADEATALATDRFDHVATSSDLSGRIRALTAAVPRRSVGRAR